ESRIRARGRLARAFGRDAFVAGTGPGPGGRLPRARHGRAGDGAQCRAGLRRDGRAQGCARGRSAQARHTKARRYSQALGMKANAACCRQSARRRSAVKFDPRERLIVALDVPSVREAEALVARLGETVSFYKIGYQLAFAGGIDFARVLAGAAKRIFLDLKLHDIGNTVARG